MIHYAKCIVAEHIWSLKKKETLWHESEIRAARKIRSTEGAMRRYTQHSEKIQFPWVCVTAEKEGSCTML